jgi:uncharacterized alkaline shock family protein YloU
VTPDSVDDAESANDADTVAGIARAVPGVVGLHAGMFGEVATYLPGRRVAGVRVADHTIDVHLTVDADAKVRETAAAVRQAVADAYPAHAIDVTVEDVVAQRNSASISGDQEK